WPDTPPREDAVGAVRAAVRSPGATGAPGEDPRGDIRPAGFHSLLGPLSQRSLGGEAEDIQAPNQPGTEGAGAMAPQGTPPRVARPAPDPESEASWPLRVLRDHGQRGCVEAVPARSHRALEEMAEPPQPRRSHRLGHDVSSVGALPAPAGDRRPLGVPSGSE